MQASNTKHQPRAHRIAIRVDATDRDSITRLATACGLSVSEFMRQAALGQRLRPVPLIPEINRRACAELGRLSSNINQIARALNHGLDADSGAQRIAQALPGLVKLLKETQSMLIQPADDEEEGLQS